jgi:hypothetical protein
MLGEGDALSVTGTQEAIDSEAARRVLDSSSV